MELGEKIRQSRLEAGLSQRQLCEGTVTRNMLSQIENGSARPSMDTLKIFAARLGKTVSYFLEEDAVVSPNQQVMADARGQFTKAAVCFCGWRKNTPRSVCPCWSSATGNWAIMRRPMNMPAGRRRRFRVGPFTT